MKKTLLIAALSMAATPAFASKARLSALGNADHVSDAQRTFARPYEATMHGEYATVEFGTANGTPRAEGGFVRQVSEGNYLGFYVNRGESNLANAVAASGIDAAAFALDNSFDIFYGSRAGEIAWGVNFQYMTADKKGGYNVIPTQDVTSGKANDMAVALGAAAGAWEADATFGLGGKGSYVAGTYVGGNSPAAGATDEVEVKANTSIDLRGAYKMDNMHYFVRYGMGGSKQSLNGTDGDKNDNTAIQIGLINTTKAEGAEFFYGVSYLMATDKATTAAGVETKTETNSLPLIVGVEADAASWIVLRGSVTHVLPFLSTTKVTNGEKDTLASNTTINAGAGFKMNKFTIDTLIAAASSGSVGTDAPNFLTNASLTYNF